MIRWQNEEWESTDMHWNRSSKLVRSKSRLLPNWQETGETPDNVFQLISEMLKLPSKMSQYKQSMINNPYKIVHTQKEGFHYKSYLIAKFLLHL